MKVSNLKDLSVSLSDTSVLIINAGSSSIKMSLFSMPSEKLLATGVADRIGQQEVTLKWNIEGSPRQIDLGAATHQQAIAEMLDILFDAIDKTTIAAVGHRIVHGGERFVAPSRLDESVITEIQSLSHLAPLHNPANLSGVDAAMQHLPGVPHVAVFDTAFHHGMPRHAFMYAVPYAWYREHGVRRYGFHGTSHHYVAQQAAAMLNRPFNDCRLITVHLGNGCSAAAIAGGISIDTTMGMTPMEGLVMGTRCGDIDPGLHEYMARESGNSLEIITDTLNHQSGLLGLSGISNDMRTLLAAADEGDERAILAVELFCYRLAKSLAGLAVALERVDAIVFTGGIGEHAVEIRSKSMSQLKLLGVKLDEQMNQDHGNLSDGMISSLDSAFPVLVVATSEEKMIARYLLDHLDPEESVS